MRLFFLIISCRDMLERMMRRRRAELDFKVLAYAINHTIMFESLLCKRFPAKEGFNFDKVSFPDMLQF